MKSLPMPEIMKIYKKKGDIERNNADYYWERGWTPYSNTFRCSDVLLRFA